MNKSYIEITESCTLFDYIEKPGFWAELWIDIEGTWECFFDKKSTSVLPITYKITKY